MCKQVEDIELLVPQEVKPASNDDEEEAFPNPEVFFDILTHCFALYDTAMNFIGVCQFDDLTNNPTEFTCLLLDDSCLHENQTLDESERLKNMVQTHIRGRRGKMQYYLLLLEKTKSVGTENQEKNTYRRIGAGCAVWYRYRFPQTGVPFHQKGLTTLTTVWLV